MNIRHNITVYEHRIYRENMMIFHWKNVEFRIIHTIHYYDIKKKTISKTRKPKDSKK